MRHRSPKHGRVLRRPVETFPASRTRTFGTWWPSVNVAFARRRRLAQRRRRRLSSTGSKPTDGAFSSARTRNGSTSWFASRRSEPTISIFSRVSPPKRAGVYVPNTGSDLIAGRPRAIDWRSAVSGKVSTKGGRRCAGDTVRAGHRAKERPMTRKLRSDITKRGLSRTPHRAFMRAMGLDDEAIARPMVGVVSMKGEQTPCNMTHGFQVGAAKEGVAQAGGTPREFTTISVSDGISMNHEGMKFSLVSRELIADSIEAVVQGLAYDALIGFGGCDKTLPGVMMGMIRCNVPSIFIYGGSALPGRFEGKTLTVLDSYEAVGEFMTGEIDQATLAGIERTCLPTIGACAGQFTANTMAMVSEAMGLTLPNVSMVPGVYAERARIARRAGRLVMQMLQRGGPLPREIVTRRSLENGAAIVAATGGSTNAALHLPALANEAGIRFTLDDVAEVFARTPLIGNLRPGGKYTAKDVYDIGGTAVVIRALVESGYIDGSCLTITGKAIAEEYGGANAPDGEIVFSTKKPIMSDGGVAVLKGNLCPDAAVIKVAGLKNLVFEGTV